MTEPTRRRPRPATDRPVMGDHPELEPDEEPRREPVPRTDRRSPLVIAGIVALVLLIVIIILLAVI